MVTLADVAAFKQLLDAKKERLEQVNFTVSLAGPAVSTAERQALYKGFELAVLELKRMAVKNREDKLGEMKKLIQCFENIELWWNRLCSLWTAYCFQNGMTPDSENYTLDLREVWAEMPENVRGDFEDFDSFMSRYLG